MPLPAPLHVTLPLRCVLRFGLRLQVHVFYLHRAQFWVRFLLLIYLPVTV